MDGDPRYLYTAKMDLKGVGLRHPRRVSGAKIDNKAHHRLIDEVAAANPEPANLDQAGQLSRRPDQHLPVAGLNKDPVVAHKHGFGYLARSSGKKEIERQPRLAGA